MNSASYALPLFALVDADKVDVESPRLPELAEQLEVYLAQKCGLVALDSKIELASSGEPYLILAEVTEAHLPALFALVDVQKTTLYRYERLDENAFRLTPILLKPGE